MSYNNKMKMMKKICPGCSNDLKFLNTPNFGGGKLSDGNRVCRFCFKILVKHDISFGLKSMKNYNSQMVTDIIKKFSRNEFIPERPIPESITHQINIPLEFEDELDNYYNEYGQEIVDTIVLIKYQDAKGNISSRRITIRSIDNKTKDFLLKAYCHERKAARSFKSSRIIEIIDIETGEIFTNPKDFLMSKLDVNNSDNITAWLNEMKHELLLMTYMAKSDGYFHPQERKLLQEFIIEAYGKPFDHHNIDSEIRRFHCDSLSFRNSLDIVAKKNQSHKTKIYEVLERLVKSDGLIDPVEKGILELIRQKWN